MTDAQKPTADAVALTEVLGLVMRLRQRRMLAADGFLGVGKSNAKLCWVTNEDDPDCAAAADELERLGTMLGGLDSHGRYWVENRGRIIDAVTAAGFQIMSDRDHCWLAPIGDKP